MVDEHGAARLVDAIVSLPALRNVLLMFENTQMLDDEYFDSIEPGLEARGLCAAHIEPSTECCLPRRWPHCFQQHAP